MPHVRTAAIKLQYIFAWLAYAIIELTASILPIGFLASIAAGNSKVSEIQVDWFLLSGLASALSLLVMILIYSLFKQVYVERAMSYIAILFVLGLMAGAAGAASVVGVAYIGLQLLWIDIAVSFVAFLATYLVYTSYFAEKYYAPPPHLHRKTSLIEHKNGKIEPQLTKLGSQSFARSGDELKVSSVRLEPAYEGENLDGLWTGGPAGVPKGETEDVVNKGWHPFPFYVLFFCFQLAKNLDYKIFNFNLVMESFAEAPYVFFMEYIAKTSVSVILMFFSISFLLLLLRTLGVGRTVRFRRAVHIFFAVLMTFATIVPLLYPHNL